MDRKKGIIAIGVLIVLIIVGIAGYMYYKRTPTYTFSLIKTAVEKHDWDTFSKHVDTENVIGTGYDAFMESALETDEDMDDSVKGMVGGFVKMMKPGIVASLNEEVKEWVKTGQSGTSTDSTDSKSNQKDKQAADKIKKNVGFEQSSYKGITSTRQDGDFTIAVVTITDKELGRDFTLDVKMRQLDDGTWQIMTISNLKDYLIELDKAKKEKLAELNKPIQEKIDKQVAVQSVQSRIAASDPWGFSHSLLTTVAIKLDSDQQIDKAEGYLYLKGDDGKQKRFPVSATIGAKTGDKMLQLRKDLNPFIGGEAQFVKADLSRYTQTLVITKLIYSDGSTLALKKSLDEDK